MNKFSVSFSGGETSAYMTYHLCRKFPNAEKLIVFANTGQENEETLEFVDRCDREFGWGVVWVEALVSPVHGEGTKHRIVNFESASRNGEPFEAVIRKNGIPNQSFPFCTRELKLRPLNSIRQLGFNKSPMAVGIRYDEWDRVSQDAEKNNLFYPLIDWRIQKSDVNRFWSEMPFRLNLKGYQGNCRTCWKKSDRKLGTIAKENPEWFDFFKEMESKYEGYAPETQPRRTLPSRFFRKHRTVADILKIPTLPGFQPASDDSLNTITFNQGELFQHGSDCGESCEVY